MASPSMGDLSKSPPDPTAGTVPNAFLNAETIENIQTIKHSKHIHISDDDPMGTVELIQSLRKKVKVLQKTNDQMLARQSQQEKVGVFADHEGRITQKRLNILADDVQGKPQNITNDASKLCTRVDKNAEINQETEDYMTSGKKMSDDLEDCYHDDKTIHKKIIDCAEDMGVDLQNKNIDHWIDKARIQRQKLDALVLIYYLLKMIHLKRLVKILD